MFSIRFIQARSLYLFPLLSEDMKIESYSHNNILQKLLTSRFTSINNLGSSRFKFYFEKSEINKTINTDFELYYTRHYYQKRNSLFLKKNKISNCWKLISDYYSFYYAAIALTRLFRKGNGYLNSEIANNLSNLISQITGNLVSIKKGNYTFHIQETSPLMYTVDFRFGQSSSHELGWNLMSEILNELLSLSSSRDEEYSVLKIILEILNSMGENFMSTIRNDVNYRGKFAIGKELQKVIYYDYTNIDEKEYIRRILKFSSEINEGQKYNLFSLYGAYISRLLDKMYADYLERIDVKTTRIKTLSQQRL